MGQIQIFEGIFERSSALQSSNKIQLLLNIPRAVNSTVCLLLRSRVVVVLNWTVLY